mgnify:CR=1 FL=1
MTPVMPRRGAQIGNLTRVLTKDYTGCPGFPVKFSIEGRLNSVTKVRVKTDEPFEKALRRFKKKCNKEGLLQRLKELKYYEKPSDRRRRKLAKAVSRAVLEQM